ncbi:MAG TPA: hypothetical protein VF514_13640 [Bacteroidota bacterium]|jgi:hypothetical protein
MKHFQVELVKFLELRAVIRDVSDGAKISLSNGRTTGDIVQGL